MLNKINVKELYDEIVRECTMKANLLPEKPEYTCFIVSSSNGRYNKASEMYVNLKAQTSKDAGVRLVVEKYTPKKFKERAKEILDYVKETDDTVRVMLQLPAHQDTIDAFNDMIESSNGKIIDVDNLTDEVYEDMTHGIFARFPATPLGVVAILKEELNSISGKKIAVVGSRSKTTGKYLIPMLIKLGAIVSGYNSQTPINEGEFNDCDAVVSCVGKSRLLNMSHCFGKKKVLIDVGVSFVDGKTVGDFDEDVRANHRYTPYTNGVGLMTRAMLVCNVLDTY